MSNLTPEFKAKELFIKFKHQIEYNCQPTIVDMVAFECALLSVEEILNLDYSSVECREYYQEVKQELINLKKHKIKCT